jgi:hypothetical protein
MPPLEQIPPFPPLPKGGEGGFDPTDRAREQHASGVWPLRVDC